MGKITTSRCAPASPAGRVSGSSCRSDPSTMPPVASTRLSPPMNTPHIPTLIVDDEVLGRDVVRNMLAAHADFAVVGECPDGERALAAIRRLAPQLVFLDVKMPRVDGVTVLKRLPEECRPLVVFVTAYDSFALDAFEGAAFDYLVKPFDQERFDAMLQRVRTRLDEIEAARLGQSVRGMVVTAASRGAPRAPLPPIDRFVVRDPGRIHFVAATEVVWLEASGNYVAIHPRSGKVHLIHETMAAVEARLDPGEFIRIHRSTIVNLRCIRQLEPHINGEFIVVLEDGARLKLSRSYAETARQALGLG